MKGIRNDWGNINPVTKVIPNKKKYNKKKDKEKLKKVLTNSKEYDTI